MSVYLEHNVLVLIQYINVCYMHGDGGAEGHCLLPLTSVKLILLSHFGWTWPPTVAITTWPSSWRWQGVNWGDRVNSNGYGREQYHQDGFMLRLWVSSRVQAQSESWKTHGFTYTILCLASWVFFCLHFSGLCSSVLEMRCMRTGSSNRQPRQVKTRSWGRWGWKILMNTWSSSKPSIPVRHSAAVCWLICFVHASNDRHIFDMLLYVYIFCCIVKPRTGQKKGRKSADESNKFD